MGEVRGLLLDFYGTLVHEDDDIIPIICEDIRISANTKASAGEIGRFWWESFSPLFQRSYGAGFLSQRNAAVQSLAETIRHFGATLNPTTLIAPQFAHWVSPAIFPDTKPFLEYLSQANVPVCIVSNIDRVDLEAALKYLDLHFEHVITSDDVKSYKPRPEMFEAALDRLGLASDEVLHVGDSRTSDIAGAQEVGIAVAWVNRAGKQGLESPFPDYTVHDLKELQVILEMSPGL